MPLYADLRYTLHHPQRSDTVRIALANSSALRTTGAWTQTLWPLDRYRFKRVPLSNTSIGFGRRSGSPTLYDARCPNAIDYDTPPPELVDQSKSLLNISTMNCNEVDNIRTESAHPPLSGLN